MSKKTSSWAFGLALWAVLLGSGPAQGQVWENITPPGSGDIYDISVCSSQPKVIYVCGPGRGVFKSTDAGDTWAQVNYGLPDDRIVAIAVNPKNPQVSLAGRFKSRYNFDPALYKTTNGGALWVRSDSDLFYYPEEATDFTSMAICPWDTNVALVAEVGGYFSGRVYRTTNGGRRWDAPIDSLGSVWGTQDILYDIRSFDVFVSASGRYYKSLDGGRSWFRWGAGLSDYAYTIGFGRLNTFYAGMRNGLYRSTDGGVTWVQLSTGLPRGGVVSVYSIVTSGRDTSLIHISCSADTSFFGVYRSADSGETWAAYNQGLPLSGFYKLVFSPDSDGTLFAAGSGVFRIRNVLSGVQEPADKGTDVLRYPIQVHMSPHPVVSVGRLEFNLAKESLVELAFYDASGRRIGFVPRVKRASGKQWIPLDVRGLSPGVYFYQLNIGNDCLKGRFVVLR